MRDRAEGTNPFATSRITTPEMLYVFSSAEERHQLIKRFRQSGFAGTIHGRHGVGKTTLALTLAHSVRHEFSHVSLLTIRGRKNVQHLWDRVCENDSERLSRTLWIIDGCERVSPLPRLIMLRHLLSRGDGVIATTHSTFARLLSTPLLRPITQLTPQFSDFKRIVHALMKDKPLMFDNATLEDVFSKSNGNFRTAFSHLYDRYDCVFNDSSTDPSIVDQVAVSYLPQPRS
ncbi:MAG: AAA family ATPase [Pirellulaceae bacterium]